MTSLKIVIILVIILLGSSSAGPLEFKIEKFKVYTYDANGNEAPYVSTNEFSLKRKHYCSKRSAKKRCYARHRHKKKAVAAIRWNMVRVKTVQGFYLDVHPAYAHKFLRFFEILAQNNVDVPKSMVGCFSSSGHVRGSNHYIGAACDIQTGWNKTIPAMYNAGRWIKAAGLYDGCSFGDCGHIEAVRGTHNKAPNLYASMEKFKADQSTANYQP